jgi:hypothetical protein
MMNCQPTMTCQPYNGSSDEYDLSDEAFKPVRVVLMGQGSEMKRGGLDRPASRWTEVGTSVFTIKLQGYGI